MKKVLLLFATFCSLCLFQGCGGGTPLPPPSATHFSVVGPTAATAGAKFNITVQALDASNRVVTGYAGTVHFSSTDPQAVLPANSALTNGTGTFSVTLMTATTESIAVTDTASSIAGTSNAIAVGAGAVSQLSVVAPGNATVGTAFTFTVTALDAANNMVTTYTGIVHFSSSDSQAILPANSTLSSGTVTLSATLKNVGTATIIASDTATASITGTSNVIDTRLVIASGVPPGGTLRTTYGFSLSAVGGIAPYVWSWSAAAGSSLPAGLTVATNADGTGTISGVPTTDGSYNVVLKVTDSESPAAAPVTASYTIAVAAPPALTVSSVAPPNGTVGAGYNPHLVRYCLRYNPFTRICIQWGYRLQFGFQFTATGGVGADTWSWAPAAGSSLPPGLVISAGGLLSGIPTPSTTTAGSYNVVVTVTDSGSPPLPTSTNYTLVISNPPPPVVSTTAPPTGAVNLAYSFTFTASSSLMPLTWSETGALPTGLSLSTAGVLSGTPAATGSSPITVTAQDTAGQTASQNFTIQVVLHGFAATGNMATPRYSHTATLLSTGKVLVAGGYNSTALATAELFDPAANTFAATSASMSAARMSHTATVLGNGKVLITGGKDASGVVLTTAELFDPATSTFAPTTGSMSSARENHTATLLVSGKVLIAGGDNGTANLATAELFDPATNTFAPASGAMSSARDAHTATLLGTGKVLLTGGWNASGVALATAELFDPGTGTFTATGSMANTRVFHTATMLGNGKVLIGGGSDGTAASATADVFDPAAGTFTATAKPMLYARYNHAAALLGDGTILLTGGFDATNTPLWTTELFDPVAGTFAETGSMGSVRDKHTATLLGNGKVLVTGGSDATGAALGTAELYQ